jgi:hypothetical protein
MLPALPLNSGHTDRRGKPGLTRAIESGAGKAAVPGASGREALLNEDQYLNWKADIISDYRQEAFSLWTVLGISLYGYFGGWQALSRLKTYGFFLVGYLASVFLLSRINYAIIMAFARRRAGPIASLPGAAREKALSRNRLVIRFLQITVNLLATLLTFLVMERFF